LPEPSDDELDMLDQALGVEDESRLACQIKISKEIDGLVVELAPAS
jgi:2Fe-2S ferredoxin